MGSKLVITGGNKCYFDYLRSFVKSIREKGQYSDKLVICDNLIEGEWDEPKGVRKTKSFTEGQVQFFKDHKADVILFDNLVSRHNVDEELINKSGGRTSRLPYKFIYTTLISEEYKDKKDWMCYFDSDVIFQSKLEKVFSFMESRKIYMATENGESIRNSKVEEWIYKTKMKGGFESSEFFGDMMDRANICSGFFGGDSEVFSSFCYLVWALSASQLANFFSDQPLINILHYNFGYPINKEMEGKVKHMAECNIEKVKFDNGKIKYNDIEPIAVHFNGGSRNVYEQALHNMKNKREDKYYVDSLWGRVKFRISRFADKIGVKI